MRGEFVCRQWNYHFTNLMVRKRAAQGPIDSAFVAIIEPYVGEPFITARRELAVADNQTDARRVVAVEVRTRNGHTDVCFADGRPEVVRTVPDAGLKLAGEFAFYSTDADGLRQATLVGGRQLEGPQVRLIAEVAERCANVSRVDYPARKMWLDQSWPPRQTPGAFEVGLPGHMTTYTAVSVEPDSGGSVVTLRRGADYFRSQVTGLDAEQAIVTTTLRPLVDHVDHNRTGWVASDDSTTTFWRATYLGAGRFQLDGPPVSRDAFGSAGVLRLWEYGVGDRLRQSTSVSLRRVEPGVFELAADVAVSVSLRGQAMEVSRDGKTWRATEARRHQGWVTLELPAGDPPLRLRLL